MPTDDLALIVQDSSKSCIFDYPDRPVRPIPPIDPTTGQPYPDYPYSPTDNWPFHPAPIVPPPDIHPGIPGHAIYKAHYPNELTTVSGVANADAVGGAQKHVCNWSSNLGLSGSIAANDFFGQRYFGGLGTSVNYWIRISSFDTIQTFRVNIPQIIADNPLIDLIMFTWNVNIVAPSGTDYWSPVLISADSPIGGYVGMGSHTLPGGGWWPDATIRLNETINIYCWVPTGEVYADYTWPQSYPYP